MVRNRRALLAAVFLAIGSCSESADQTGSGAPAPPLADAECPGSAGAAGSHAPPDDDGNCTSGDTRCQGETGYQQCTPDGAWGGPSSCSSYGESNHCMLVGPEYAACVDPACWYWNVAGLLDDSHRVGVCAPDGGFMACSSGGTLASASDCAGLCVTVTVINGQSVGFCRAECEDGAQECLGGPLYRECVAGLWQRSARLCEGGSSCQPLADTALPQIQCGDACSPGTSRCAGKSAIEHCGDDGVFEAAEECARGVCQSKGVQAYCAAECLEGASDCSYDGAPSVRTCVDPGQWSADEPCDSGMICRTSGGMDLGCAECVGPAAPGGNAWGVADSRCDGEAVVECGEDNRWQSGRACGAGETCIQLDNGVSTLAYCAVAP